MDANHRNKSPDFTSLENSPPNFSGYEFSDPANPSFEGFTNYIYPGSPRMDFASLSLSTSHPHPPQFFANPSAIFSHNASGSRTAGGSPTSLGSGPHTPLETIAPPLTYPHEASGSELEEATGSGSTSPANGRSMPQHQAARGVNRFNPISTSSRPPRAASKRSATATRRNLRRDDDDMSDDDIDANTEEASLATDVNGNIATPDGSRVVVRRREEIRRQRIESEQRRRDELREGYAKLKHTLPPSNQKSSKVSLLDRAVTYIRHLEASQSTLNTRLNNAEDELRRQRDVNENLMRTLTEQHRAVGALAAAHAATTGNVLEPTTPEGSKKAKRPSL